MSRAGMYFPERYATAKPDTIIHCQIRNCAVLCHGHKKAAGQRRRIQQQLKLHCLTCGLSVAEVLSDCKLNPARMRNNTGFDILYKEMHRLDETAT